VHLDFEAARREDRAGVREYRIWVKDGCGRQVDGAAGLPSAAELPYAPRQLQLVPIPDFHCPPSCETALIDYSSSVSRKAFVSFRSMRPRD
jgi:hypothetical protein